MDIAAVLSRRIYNPPYEHVLIKKDEQEISRCRSLDGYIDCLQLCLSFQRAWHHMARTNMYRDAVAYVSSKYPSPVKEGLSLMRGREMWCHPKLAMHIASWISMELGDFIQQWIMEKLICGSSLTVVAPPLPRRIRPEPRRDIIEPPLTYTLPMRVRYGADREYRRAMFSLIDVLNQVFGGDYSKFNVMTYAFSHTPYGEICSREEEAWDRPYKRCGHNGCELGESLSLCCSCSDRREDKTIHQIYIDGKGYIEKRGSASMFYCRGCRGM